MYLKPMEVMMQHLHISRVIGLPGETVQISDGKILINGAVYNENKDFPEISNAGLASRLRFRWKAVNILYLEITGTTVRTAVMLISEM